MKVAREGERVCTPNASEDMGWHRGTWMEGVKDSVGSWEGRNN